MDVRRLAKVDLIFVVILLIATGARLYLAVNEEYIHDENNTTIPLATTISFAPSNLHVPLRGENHGALPAYIVKASSSLFGTSRLAYRLLHVLLGLCTMAAVFRLTLQWHGPVAARWAAALFSLNEYYLAVSSRATAHVPHFFFVTAAIYAVARFLSTQRAPYLYAVTGSLGLAFYCKEHSALVLPVLLLVFLQRGYRQWLRSRHLYLACALFLVVIAPDIVWNARNTEEPRITYGDHTLRQATYTAHLRRIGGIGFSPYPSMFYFRNQVGTAYRRMTGTELKDETPEYRSINPLLGVLLLGAVVMTTLGPSDRDPVRTLLLTLFWGLFVFFSVIKKGDPPGRLDPASWIWVEVTLIPATILAGARLARATGILRVATWAFAALAVMVSLQSFL